MNVIPLTLSISLTLAFSFIVFFVAQNQRGHRGGSERDSLMPLADEARRPVAARAKRSLEILPGS